MSRWTAEDLKPFKGVSAVIAGKEPGTVLLQNHVKLQRWVLPCGKALEGEDPAEAMKRELKEECGIDVTDMSLLTHTTLAHKHSDLPGGVRRIPTYIYTVNKYEGKLRNVEPHKHTEQTFKDPHKLALTGVAMGEVLKYYLRHKRKTSK